MPNIGVYTYLPHKSGATYCTPASTSLFGTDTRYGYATAVSDASWLIVGAWQASKLFIYERVTDTVDATSYTLSSTITSDNFFPGTTIDAYENRFVCGKISASNYGYIYEHDGSSWTSTRITTGLETRISKICKDTGNKVLFTERDSGRFKVYKWVSGTSWTLDDNGYISEASTQNFSYDVAENVIATGDPTNRKVRIYKYGTSWALDQTIESTTSYFGRCVAISKTILAIGSTKTATDTSFTGQVDIYKYNGSSYIYSQTIADSSYHNFGESVAINAQGTKLFVSASRRGYGAAYDFELTDEGVNSSFASSSTIVLTNISSFDSIGHYIQPSASSNVGDILNVDLSPRGHFWVYGKNTDKIILQGHFFSGSYKSGPCMISGAAATELVVDQPTYQYTGSGSIAVSGSAVNIMYIDYEGLGNIILSGEADIIIDRELNPRLRLIQTIADASKASFGAFSYITDKALAVSDGGLMSMNFYDNDGSSYAFTSNVIYSGGIYATHQTYLPNRLYIASTNKIIIHERNDSTSTWTSTEFGSSTYYNIDVVDGTSTRIFGFNRDNNYVHIWNYTGTSWARSQIISNQNSVGLGIVAGRQWDTDHFINYFCFTGSSYINLYVDNGSSYEYSNTWFFADRIQLGNFGKPRILRLVGDEITSASQTKLLIAQPYVNSSLGTLDLFDVDAVPTTLVEPYGTSSRITTSVASGDLTMLGNDGSFGFNLNEQNNWRSPWKKVLISNVEKDDTSYANANSLFVLGSTDDTSYTDLAQFRTSYTDGIDLPGCINAYYSTSEYTYYIAYGLRNARRAYILTFDNYYGPTYEFDYTGSGSAETSGAADIETYYDYEYTGSGVATLSGAADTEEYNEYEYTGSGEITLSGAADTAILIEYDYTGSGEITLSGESNYDLVINVAGSGGITISGTADTIIDEFFYVGSGGIETSGAADTEEYNEYEYTGSGVATLSGAADTEEYNEYEYTGSGEITLSGAADTSQANEYEYTGSGEIVLSGDAEYDVIFQIVGNGEVIISGAAITTCSSDFIYVGSGGIETSGAADTEEYNEYEYTGSGEIVISGAAITSSQDEYEYTGSGEVELSGDAEYDVIFQIVGNGTIVLSGTSDTDILIDFEGAGSITLSGVADTDINIDREGSGVITISGAANTSSQDEFHYEGSGAVATTGTADTDLDIDREGSGSITISGAADTILNEFFVVGSGQVELSGAADTEEYNDYEYTGSGVIETSGTGDTSIEIAYDASGSVATTGVADTDLDIDREGSGSITISGTADTILNEFFVVGSGEITLSGSAETEEFNYYEYEGSGVATLSGAADTEEFNYYDYEASGAVATTGVADTDINIDREGSGSITISGTADTMLNEFFVVGSGGVDITGDAALFIDVNASVESMPVLVSGNAAANIIFNLIQFNKIFYSKVDNTINHKSYLSR